MDCTPRPRTRHAVPVIGIVGGIGSGKSFVARLFHEAGCQVLDSDAQVKKAYARPDVRQKLAEWWGPEALLSDAEVNRKWIAAKIFSDPAERRRLESLLHPIVGDMRQAEMCAALAHARPPVAFVWDTPLLFETGLDASCDAVVFVDAPDSVRRERVSERGWGAEELTRRENSQWPLDKKRCLSEYLLTNAAPSAASEPGPESKTTNLSQLRGDSQGTRSSDVVQIPISDLRDQVRLILQSILNRGF